MSKAKKKTVKKIAAPVAIRTVADVRKFFSYLLKTRKVSFHPDDDFKNYVENNSGKRCFTNDEAKKYNKLMNDAFKVCEKEKKDIYSIGLRQMRQLLQIK